MNIEDLEMDNVTDFTMAQYKLYVLILLNILSQFVPSNQSSQ